MIITLCGSARFEAWFHLWNKVLTLSGHTVFSLSCFPSVEGEQAWYTQEQKAELDKAHFRKIALSSAVVVLNPFAYLGESTRNEIAYAQSLGIKVHFLESWGLDCGINRGVLHIDALVRAAAAYKVKDFGSPIDTSIYPSVWSLLGPVGSARSSLVLLVDDHKDKLLAPHRYDDQPKDTALSKLGDQLNKLTAAAGFYIPAKELAEGLPWQLVTLHHDDVRAFYQKFGLLHFDVPGHLTTRKMKERIDFLREELTELELGAEAQDLAEQADALVDLIYVALGTVLMLGLPWQKLWDDVQRANMAKVRGVTKRGHPVDVTKPPGWVGPKTLEILKAAGYDPAAWVDERTHRDDSRQLPLPIKPEVQAPTLPDLQVPLPLEEYPNLVERDLTDEEALAESFAEVQCLRPEPDDEFPYVCTRPKYHAGQHVACVLDRVLVRWPNNPINTAPQQEKP